jgi:hypothetical protein
MFRVIAPSDVSRIEDAMRQFRTTTNETCKGEMMKKFYLRIAVALVGLAGLGITTKAQAAVDQLVVTVPFEFVVGGTTLPAGTYRVHRLSDDNPSEGLVLSSYENRVITTVLPIDVESTHDNKPEAAFETAGDQHLLSRIQTADHVFNIPIAKSARTAILAHNAKSSFGSPGSK